MQIGAYYKYWKNRRNAHGIHSPFVFDFYNSVLVQAHKINDHAISAYRNEQLHDRREINLNDLGAGSKRAASNTRRISDIAKTAAVSAKFGRLLTCILERYKIEQVVELGTSLGIGTLYLSQPDCVKKVITIEGDRTLTDIASRGFSKLNRTNIQQIHGNFDDILESLIPYLPQTGLVYIDGNHQYEATLRYFEFFLNFVDDNTFLVFDDIYWSEGMKQAWEKICASPGIHVSMDLFRMGIVCKRKIQAKEHFVLKY